MERSVSSRVFEAGQQLATASGVDLARALDEALNQFLGWPFRAATGLAIDADGQRTDVFDALIYTTSQSQSASSVGPLNVNPDSLACVIDVSETVDAQSLRTAYERVATAKRLKKTPAPQLPGFPHTTTTLGVIFARDAAVPLEKLAEELDQLNKAHPDREWTDLVVVLCKGTINYAVQFPGEPPIADYLPPAEGATSSFTAPMYIVLFIRPTGAYTFNKMCAFLLAHLAIFSPGANLPNWTEVLEGIPKYGMTVCGYQYNLTAC